MVMMYLQEIIISLTPLDFQLFTQETGLMRIQVTVPTLKILMMKITGKILMEMGKLMILMKMITTTKVHGMAMISTLITTKL